MNLHHIIYFKLTEKYPQQYYRILCKAVESNYDLRQYINDTSYYHSWYSNHIFCLSYCVGNLKYVPETDSTFYGKNTYIDENFGIKILDKLIELDANLYSKNYYNDTIIESIYKAGLTKDLIMKDLLKNLLIIIIIVTMIYYKNKLITIKN